MSFGLKPLNIPITAENKFSSIFKTLKNDLNDTGTGVKRFNTKLKKTSAMMAQKGQTLKKFGATTTNVGKTMTLGLTAPIVALGYASVKAFRELEDGMQNVASLDVGEARIKELTKDVSDLTVETGKSATDITGGLYQVVSAFGDSADSAEILRINARGAAAGLATTTDAINLTSAVTKAYGDTSAASVRKVTDLAFQTVKLGQTTFPELAASIGKVTSVSDQLGIKQKDLFGIYAAGTGVVGTAAEVSTKFAGTLNALTKPTADMTKLYKAMGVAGGKELIAKTGGIAQAMKSIADYATKTKTPLGKFIGQAQSANFVTAMTGKLYDSLTKKTLAMSKATGAADAAFRKQAKTFSFKLAQLKALVNVNLVEIGSIIVPVLLDIMKSVTPLIKSFGNLSPEMKKIIVVGAGIVAALGPVLIVLGSVVSAVGTLLTLGSTILPTLAPVITFFSSFGSVLASFGSILASTLTPVITFFSGFGSVLASIPALFNPITIAVGAFAGVFAGSLFLFEKFFTNIKNSKIASQRVKDYATDWLNGLELMKSAFANFGGFVSDVFTSVWEGIKTGMDAIVYMTKNMVNGIASIIPDWIKEGIGVDLNTNVSGGTTNNVMSEQITKMQNDNFMTKKILEQQNVNVNFGNAPKGTTMESEGGNFAQLNMGFAQ